MFKEALIKSAKQLTKLKNMGVISDFALIGGIALSAYLEPRATGDIDYVLRLNEKDLNTVAHHLNGEAHKGDIFDPLAGSISFSVKILKNVISIQLIQFHLALEKIAIENIKMLPFGKNKLPIVNPRGLIVLKLYAGGPVDLEDARKLLSLKEIKTKDRNYIEAKAKSLRISSRLKHLNS